MTIATHFSWTTLTLNDISYSDPSSHINRIGTKTLSESCSNGATNTTTYRDGNWRKHEQNENIRRTENTIRTIETKKKCNTHTQTHSLTHSNTHSMTPYVCTVYLCQYQTNGINIHYCYCSHSQIYRLYSEYHRQKINPIDIDNNDNKFETNKQKKTN